MAVRSPKPLQLVLNSFCLFRDITPRVLEEIGDGGEDKAPVLSGGDPELYDVIRSGGHQILLTESLRSEYLKEARIRGASGAFLETVFASLAGQGLIVRPRLGGGLRRVNGIPQRHRVFPDTAVTAKADLLITENRVWHSRSELIAELGPNVISPGQFVTQERFS